MRLEETLCNLQYSYGYYYPYYVNVCTCECVLILFHEPAHGMGCEDVNVVNACMYHALDLHRPRNGHNDATTDTAQKKYSYTNERG